MAYQPDGGAGSQPEAGDEPGAVDNRLSLNPNDELWADKIKDWEDGEKYPLSALGNVQLLQISPGEFEIVKGDEAEPAEESAPAAETTEAAPAAYDNPAIAKMMAGPKR
jgi:hypothetical protein